MQRRLPSHVNVLEPTWEGPNIVRCIDPQIEASAEEEEEEEEEKNGKRRIACSKKDVNKIDQRKKRRTKNTAVVDAFSGDTPLKVRTCCFSIAVPNRSYARGIQNLEITIHHR